MKAKAVLRKNAKQQKTDFDEEFAQIRKIELEFDKKQYLIEKQWLGRRVPYLFIPWTTRANLIKVLSSLTRRLTTYCT